MGRSRRWGFDGGIRPERPAPPPHPAQCIVVAEAQPEAHGHGREDRNLSLARHSRERDGAHLQQGQPDRPQKRRRQGQQHIARDLVGVQETGNTRLVWLTVGKREIELPHHEDRATEPSAGRSDSIAPKGPEVLAGHLDQHLGQRVRHERQPPGQRRAVRRVGHQGRKPGEHQHLQHQIGTDGPRREHAASAAVQALVTGPARFCRLAHRTALWLSTLRPPGP